MEHLSRRKFIKKTGHFVAGASLLPVAAYRGKVVPSDTIQIGLIGCRSMGFGNLENALRVDGVQCLGLCDVDQTVLENRAGDVERMTGEAPSLYKDYRELLDNKDLDAVIIGTPDHWHCLQTIHALEAEKHIYVEKPLANSIAEINAVKKAAGKYNQVVQVGQQQRSGAHWQHAVNMVQDGALGTIKRVNVWGNFGYGAGAVPVGDSEVPDGVDYDMWLGPAPERAFNQNHFHGSWRFYWAYGGGVQTDWGVHLLDIALWAMQVKGMPKSIYSAGGILSGLNRSIDVADTQTTIYDFDSFIMEWKHTGGPEIGPYNRNYGIEFVGSEAILIINRESWEVIPVPGSAKEQMQGPGQSSYHFEHAQNFINSIRGTDSVNAPVEAGYQAAWYAHLGNISYLSGDTLYPDENGVVANEHKYSQFMKPEYRVPWTFPSI